MFLNPTHITQEWNSGWSVCACLIFNLLFIKLQIYIVFFSDSYYFNFFSYFLKNLIHLFSSYIVLLLLLLFCDYVINPGGKTLYFSKIALVNRMEKMFKQKSKHLSSRVKHQKAYKSPECPKYQQSLDFTWKRKKALVLWVPSKN